MGLKVALAQMNIAFGEPEKNYEKVKSNIEEAAKKGSDVVVFPELWNTGYDLERLDEIADPEGKNTIDFISSLAKQHDINVVAGSIAKSMVDNQVTNTMLIFNRKGELVKEYSKVHLFRLMNEEKFLIEGNSEGSFNLDGISSVGVICYDIRFPEWIRTHMLYQTKILYVVAEWPKARIDHWRALLISRAIENQCYVVACNRVGSDPNNVFGGHSIIVGPWGEVLAEAGEEETILFGEVDLEQVDKVRNTIPIFSDRRPDMYKL